MVRKILFEVCANCGKKIIDDEAAMLVDEHNDLIFCSDDCVHEHFEAEVDALETEHIKLRGPTDILLKDFKKYENFLPMLLNEPDEIWESEVVDEESPMSFYIGEFFHESERIYYLAAVYQVDQKPSFVYIHFPTRDLSLVEKYRRGELVYDGGEVDSIDMDDEVTENNIAIELYNDMLENRSEVDIDPEDFSSYNELKLMTVEHPEEIWKRIDDTGNTFIVFVAHHQRESELVGYVVVAVEDDLVGAAVPIFGFPTLDQKLLDRFRIGEILFKESEEF